MKTPLTSPIRPLRALGLSAVSLILAASAGAQDLGIKAAPQKRPVVINNAVVHTISGEIIKGGHVSFADGVITSVGPGPAPGFAGQEPTVIDAAGKSVFPTLIGANTVTGLLEVNAARATKDANETGDFTPEVRPASAINPD